MAEREYIENLQAWSEIVIKRWRNRMSRMKVNDTGALRRSFLATLEQDAKGNPDKIMFAFLYYGKFVDMGVGKGTNLSQRGQTKRIAKLWYTKGFTREIAKLADIMAERYGRVSKDILIKTLEMRVGNELL